MPSKDTQNYTRPQDLEREGNYQSTSRSNPSIDHLVLTLGGDANSDPIELVKNVKLTAQHLMDTIVKDKNSLQSILDLQLDSVSRHLATGQSLSVTAQSAQEALQNLEKDFDASTPKGTAFLGEFLEQSVARHRFGRIDLVSREKYLALLVIKLRYDDLAKLEDAVWAGRTGEDWVISELRRARQEQVISEAVKGNVLASINSRLVLLYTMVTEQLAKVWSESISVRKEGDQVMIEVQTTTQLSIPHYTRMTLGHSASHTQGSQRSYSLSEIYNALNQLDILPSLLSEFRSRFLRNFIGPLVAGDYWTLFESVTSDRSIFRLKRAARDAELDMISSVQKLFTFVAQRVYPPSNASLPDRENFLASLYKETFQIILDQVIIPKIPSTLKDVPKWLQFVQQCVDCEKFVSTDTQPVTIMKTFCADEVSIQWMDKRRQLLANQMRQLVSNEWRSWTSERIDVTETAKSPIRLAPERSSNEENGWGFDDDNRDVVESNQLRTNDDKNEGASGWDFNDWDEPTLPQTPVVKPAKEAKRLGKKLTSKSSATPSPAKPNTMPSTVHTAQIRQLNTCLVSITCQRALQIAQDVLSEAESVSSITFAAPSFITVSRGLTDMALESLDIIRASAPIIFASELQSNAAISMQLNNDFNYIAQKVAKWNDKSLSISAAKVSLKFKLAADAVFSSTVRRNLESIAALMDGADHFTDIGSEKTFKTQATIVKLVVEHVQKLASEVKPVLITHTYHTLIGKILEAIVSRILYDILDLIDITEVESGRLESLIKLVENLQYLFSDNNDEVVTVVATFVPSWLKFCYISELLRANLVDITYLFENGSLVDFNPTELTKLVRALFAESHKRTTLLDKLIVGSHDNHSS